MHVYSFCVVVVCAWRGYPTVSVLNSGSFNSRVRCSAGAWVGVLGQGPSSGVEAGGWDEDWEWDVRVGPTSLGGPMC